MGRSVDVYNLDVDGHAYAMEKSFIAALDSANGAGSADRLFEKNTAKYWVRLNAYEMDFDIIQRGKSMIHNGEFLNV